MLETNGECVRRFVNGVELTPEIYDQDPAASLARADK